MVRLLTPIESSLSVSLPLDSSSEPREILTTSSQQKSRKQEEIASTTNRDSPAVPVYGPRAAQLPPLLTARPITKTS
jgi:hypothetical protein